MEYFYYTLIGIGFFTVLKLNSGKTYNRLPNFPSILNSLLMLFVIVAMALKPIVIYDDKYNYRDKFINASIAIFIDAKDIGWSLYTFFVKIIFDNPDIYFFLTAFIYTIGYYVFAKKYIPRSMIFIFLIASFSSFGFLAYGTNTIRAGFALSLLLIALSFNKKIFYFILFGALAVLSHKSMALPLLVFFLTRFYNNSKGYFRVWFLTFVISIINVGFIVAFFENALGSFDDRSSSYFASQTTIVYKSGFRLDFIIYSVVPIALGYYYIVILKIRDLFYIRLYNTYILVNAVWLIVIRMPFTDRIAYLSWFLIPFILLYPPLKYRQEMNSKQFVFIILVGVLAFTTFMQFK